MLNYSNLITENNRVSPDLVRGAIDVNGLVARPGWRHAGLRGFPRQERRSGLAFGRHLQKGMSRRAKHFIRSVNQKVIRLAFPFTCLPGRLAPRLADNLNLVRSSLITHSI